MAKKEMALVKADEFVALSEDFSEVKEIISENLGNMDDADAFSLPSVKMPTGGGVSWSVPTLEGEESEKEVEGVIVYNAPCRAFWPGDFAGGEPPQCSSTDGIIGQGDPGGSCRSCPYSKFGSDEKSGGQACKAMQRLFMLRGEEVLPTLVTLPPTSKKPFRQFVTSLTSRRIPYYAVKVAIGLEKATNRGGINYAKATFKVTGRIDDPKLLERIRAYRAVIEPIISQKPVDAEEYMQSQQKEEQGEDL